MDELGRKVERQQREVEATLARSQAARARANVVTRAVRDRRREVLDLLGLRLGQGQDSTPGATARRP